MNVRGVLCSEPARLSLKHACLRIEKKDQEPASIPLEDLNYLLLESRQLTISSALLAACAEQGCLVITCDEQHLPNGLLLPFYNFYRQREMLLAQLAVSRPQQKRLWQQIIQAKIGNQAACLERLSKTDQAVSAKAERVAALVARVKSGDADNIEAQAARLYWGAFAEGFQRQSEGLDRLNSLLNYGYALLRAVLARDLAAYGFAPCLGLHHCSMENAFNLADDLIEPWRPFVDAWARERFLLVGPGALDTEDRRSMLGVLYAQVAFADGECQLLTGLRRQVEQARGWYLGRNTLTFPSFTPLASTP